MLYSLVDEESLRILHSLLKFLSNHKHIAEYSLVRNQIFEEYFIEHRKYLLEIYLDVIAKIYETDAVKAHEFITAFIGKYLAVVRRERQYFTSLMSETNLSRFEAFRRENEFDLLSKRIRPWIVGCTDFQDLCMSIDAVNQVMLCANEDEIDKLERFSAERLF